MLITCILHNEKVRLIQSYLAITKEAAMKPLFLYDKFILIKFLIFYSKKIIIINRGRSLETQIFFHTLISFFHTFPDLENT